MNQKEISAVLNILENVHTESEILEKSSLIYSSPVVDKKTALENIIRFGNLDVETLTLEHNKLDKLFTKVKENNIVLEEYTQNYMNKMKNLVDNRLKKSKLLESGESKVDGYDFLISVYENSLYDVPEENYYIATESVDVGTDQSVAYVIESLGYNDKITGNGIITACKNVFMSPTLKSRTEEFTNILKERIVNTIRYEMAHEEYKDIPMLEVMHCCEQHLIDKFDDNEDIVDQIEKMFDYIEDEIKDEIESFRDKIVHYLTSDLHDEDDLTPEDFSIRENLSMNPFNSVYQMTPFPVGVRTVARTMNDCLNADTDEALIESLNKFGQLMTVCEIFGEDILTEGADSLKNKAKRAVKKSANAITHTVQKAKKTANDGKVATKKIVDPMVRFVENTYDEATKKDLDERKQAIMAKGLKGKVLRIAKWIKDVAIGAIATGACASMGFSVGTVISAIALLAYIARNAKLNSNARNQVIKELEDELAITKEKIEDSRGDDVKQNKYQLMRIQSKLEKELNRIKMHKEY